MDNIKEERKKYNLVKTPLTLPTKEGSHCRSVPGERARGAGSMAATSYYLPWPVVRFSTTLHILHLRFPEQDVQSHRTKHVLPKPASVLVVLVRISSSHPELMRLGIRLPLIPPLPPLGPREERRADFGLAALFSTVSEECGLVRRLGGCAAVLLRVFLWAAWVGVARVHSAALAGYGPFAKVAAPVKDFSAPLTHLDVGWIDSVN